MGGRNFCPPSLSCLEQDIERETYRIEKAKLLSEKKSLDEKMARIEQKQNDRLEPMKEWIKVATNLVKIARDSNLLKKKVAAKEPVKNIGSNHFLILGERKFFNHLCYNNCEKLVDFST